MTYRWPWKALSGTNPTKEKLSKATQMAFAIQSLHTFLQYWNEIRKNGFRKSNPFSDQA